MSEQEKQKAPTAVEIERLLREKREKELEQAVSDEADSNEAGKGKNRLGIEKLKKSRKGLVIIIAAFVLLALGATLYSFPSILRSMFSSEDKGQKQEEVSKSSVNRLTNLSNDVDPFDSSSKQEQQSTDGNAGTTDKAAGSPALPPVNYSRALDVSYGDSGSGSASSESRSEATETHEGGSDTPQEGKPTQARLEARDGDRKSLSQIRRLPYDPNLFIPENTAIPCSLDRRFVSDLAGRLTCTVNDDIYSANGNVKLIEKGTSASLLYKSGSLRHGQGAVFIMATKLRTRTQPFLEIPLIDTQAAGALGEAGASGWIDTHFGDRFFGAMMIGMIPDVAQWASGAAKNNKDNQTDYTANSRQAFAEIAREAFANSVNIPPTLYKNQGEIITLITGEDLDFSSVYQLRRK